MASQFETFVLVEMTVQTGLLGEPVSGDHPLSAISQTYAPPVIKRLIRTYTDKSVGEEALALLRDAFSPDHVCQFDLLAIPHVD